MSKREKIILIVMVLAVIVGGYDFLFTSSSDNDHAGPELTAEDLNHFVTQVAESLSKKDLSKADIHILAQARAGWKSDPFLKSKLPVKLDGSINAAATDVAGVRLSYSGYLTMGSRQLAVINGMEYSVGDELNQSEYIVESIAPNLVVIGVTGKSDKIVIPLEETD
jgi:hypothetical protein